MQLRSSQLYPLLLGFCLVPIKFENLLASHNNGFAHTQQHAQYVPRVPFTFACIEPMQDLFSGRPGINSDNLNTVGNAAQQRDHS